MNQNPHNKMLITTAVTIFIIAQTIAWFQINGQFVFNWCKINPFMMSLLGVPISYLLLIGTDMAYQAMEGAIWPGRLLTFACGILVFILFTYLFLGEGMNWKTIASLLLTFVIVGLQLIK